MENNRNQDNIYRVYRVGGMQSDTKSFSNKEDAHSYAKKLIGGEFSNISLMDWSEQKKHLEVILSMTIICSQGDFLVHFKGIGVTEEEIQTKINEYEENFNEGECAIVEGPDANEAYKWDLAFSFVRGLHWILSQY